MRRPICLAAMILALCAVQADAAGSGRALHLGKNGSLTAPLPSTSARNITIEMWVRPSADSSVAQLLYIGNGSMNGFGMMMHDGVAGRPGLNFSLHMAGVSLSATGTNGSLPVGRWTHIAVTRGTTEWKLYRNGALVGRSIAEPYAPSSMLMIGPDFEGDIDEVRVWERERTDVEIQQTLTAPPEAGEVGLRVYYDMSDGFGSGVRNRAAATGPAADGVLAGDATFFEGDLGFTSTLRPVVQLTSFPAHMQFVPRAEDGFGTVSATGVVKTPGFDSIAVEITREGEHYASISAPLKYSTAGAPFAIDARIQAELAEYTIRLSAVKGSEKILIGEGADIVAGDVYMIAGEARAGAADRTVLSTNRFVRSFGVQTTSRSNGAYNTADTMWGRANASGMGDYSAGPLQVGIWGLRLQEIVTENQGIPVCIINGAVDGSLIEMNVPGASRTDINTIYGSTLFRAERAGLRQSVRAIFWYHGESQTADGYATSFARLHSAWRQDYPGLEKIYVFQIRPVGCGVGPHAALRELQRTLPRTYEDVEVLATAGIEGHTGCGYTVDGYHRLAERVYSLVARDLYGSTDTVGISSPDLNRVYFTSAERDEIALLFDGENNRIVWPQDTMVAGAVRSMADAFYLDGVAGEVVGGRTNGDTLFLALRGPSDARTLSYLPDRPWYDNSNVVYQGPWLNNGHGIGVLSFSEQPIRGFMSIASSVEMVKASPTSVEIMPNPATSFATVRFDVGSSEEIEVSIFDMQGVMLMSRRTSGVRQIGFDLSALPQGVYLCRIGNVNRIFSIVR